MNKTTDIIVLSREKVANFVTDRPYIWISVRDPGTALAEMPENPNEVARLHLEFSDWDLQKFPELQGNKQLKAFHQDDAKSILQIVSLTIPYVNLIVVNCEAGISRSAGIAAALSKLLTNDDTFFFKAYRPNMYVYRTILNLSQDMRPIGE